LETVIKQADSHYVETLSLQFNNGVCGAKPVCEQKSFKVGASNTRQRVQYGREFNVSSTRVLNGSKMTALIFTIEPSITKEPH
ncbi:MAG TPA: hypothetical protein DCG12_20490, partial [Planctomycetaceae bacterium]|nr:hypothetical protein [Planctomycetaceae bacterium]